MMNDMRAAPAAELPRIPAPGKSTCAKKLATFCRDHDMSKATAYRLINAGILKAHKRGGCTVILAESEVAYLASLPQKPAR